MSHDRAAFAGQIADVRVHDLLLTILEGRHTGIASFQTEIGSATLWFRDGQLVDADMGRHHMEAAVRRLLPLSTGSFEVEFKPIDRRRVITATTHELIAPFRPAAAPQGAAPHEDAAVDDASDASGGGQAGGARARRPAAGWRPTAGGGGRAVPSPSDRGSRAPDPVAAALSAAANPLRAAAPVPAAPEAGKPAPRKTMSFSGIAHAPSDDPSQVFAGDDARSRLAALRHAGPVPADALLGELGAPATGEPATPDPVVKPKPSIVVRFAPPPSAVPDEAEREPVEPAPAVEAPVRETIAPAPSLPATTATVAPTVAAPALAHTSERPGAPPSTVGHAAGAPAAPVADEGSDIAKHLGRPRRAAARRSVPFEPERIDRTLMRAGPFPPAVAIPSEAPPPGDASALGPVTTPPVGESVGTSARADTARPPRGTTEHFDVGAGPRGTFVLAQSPLGSPAAPVPIPMGGPEAGAPATMHWPDSAPIDVPYGGPSVGGIAPAPAPAVVGRYEVLLRIARGGMGTVYLCRVTGEGGFRRLFALKVIRDHLSASPEYVAMLLQEARIASRLHHPNVVSIVDIGTLANQHYLVMDYVEGCTFSELLKAHPRVRPPQFVVPIVIDALTGLHAAHTLTEDDGRPFPLVHCDFSPQNMLVGAGGICRITDFGIAKAVDALPDRSGVTRGKPGYLSPEQVLGRPIDHRSDIFSAGVVLWNALTGERLFDSDTPDATLQQVLHRPIPPPSSVGLRPPACFDAICLTALERDPDRRYQTAEQMLVDLRRAAVAHDYLAPQSDIAKWVQDTFGHQIELRRQAAGIAPRPVPSQFAAMALSNVGEVSGGHPAQLRRDGSDTGAFGAAGSRTALLRSDVTYADPAMLPSRAVDDGLGQRARAAVFVLSALAAGAIAALLIARPDLLRGGMLDETGEYHPWTPPPQEGIGGPAVEPDTGTPPAAATGDSDGATPEHAGTDTSPALPTEAGEAGETPEPDVEPSTAPVGRSADARAVDASQEPEPEAPVAKPKRKPKPKPKPEPKAKPELEPKAAPEPEAAEGSDTPPAPLPVEREPAEPPLDERDSSVAQRKPSGIR